MTDTEAVRVVVSIVASLLLIGLIVLFYVLYRKFYRKHRDTIPVHQKQISSSLHEINGVKWRDNFPDGIRPQSLPLDQRESIVTNPEAYLIDKEWLRPLHIGLGQGYAGVVKLMMFCPPKREPYKVAVKNIRPGKTDYDHAFLEIQILASCHHPNIVSFIGYHKDELFDSYTIVTEYMHGGNLHEFLRNPENRPTIRQLFSYMLQIVEAMIYISHRHWVHRDVAARNCLLDITHTIIKITDFGLSRECNWGDYEYISPNGQDTALPFRWTAPEVLFNPNAFSDKSDVWSYGVLLWEIFTRGEIPYGEMNQEQLKQFLFAGKRLHNPIESLNEIYNIMLRCWEENRNNRPKFDDLKIEINAILEQLENKKFEELRADEEYVSNYERPTSTIIESPVSQAPYERLADFREVPTPTTDGHELQELSIGSLPDFVDPQNHANQ